MLVLSSERGHGLVRFRVAQARNLTLEKSDAPIWNGQYSTGAGDTLGPVVIASPVCGEGISGFHPR